jgi:ABC-type multidrug transport system ATPase subunit
VGGRVLLPGLDLALDAGGSVGLTGPSGCGKSTLLRVLCGLSNPREGDVRLEGRRPEEIGWPKFRRQVILVQQKPTLGEGTVREVLTRSFKYRAAENAYDEVRALALLRAMDLPDCLGQSARTLSVGQQQRVSLARALLAAPKVLLLDEPTSALDEASEDRVREVLQVYTENGGGLFMVTHNKTQAREWCGEVVALEPCL